MSATSADAARAAIEGRLLSMWTDDGSTCRCALLFENTDVWTTAVDGSVGLQAPPVGLPWMRCTIREGQGLQKDLNPNPRVRYVGLIWLQIFVPRGTGTSAAKALGDLTKPIFNLQSFAGIHCRAADPQERGEDQQLWEYDVKYPYYRDEFNS